MIFDKQQAKQLIISQQNTSEKHSDIITYKKIKIQEKQYRKLYSSNSCEKNKTISNIQSKTQLQKIKNNQEIQSTKRLAQTSIVKRRSHITDSYLINKMTKTKKNSIQQSKEIHQSEQRLSRQLKKGQILEKKYMTTNITPIKSSYKFLQKKYNQKGELNNRNLQDWLNEILIENCENQHLDTTIEHIALKKFNIDRNSLQSQGITPTNVQRIYKSLFVYSIGFNSLLQQVCLHNLKAKTMIWRIYSILIQHCSNGMLELVIGQFQKEMTEQIKLLKKQIEHKQYQAENHIKMNQQKNSEIFKNIKRLKDQNINLNNEKAIIIADLKEVEQSFHEEISLRLRFETKINYIYELYQELNIKHQKLLQDFIQKNQQLQIIKLKYDSKIKQFDKMKQEHSNVKQEIQKLKSKQIQYHKQLLNLNKQLKLSNIKCQDYQQKKSEMAITLQHNNIEFEHLKKEKQNTETMYSLKQKSYQQLFQSYLKILKQNDQLRTKVCEQSNKISQYLSLIRNSNNSNASFLSEISLLQNKINQYEIIITQNKGINKELNQRIIELKQSISMGQTKSTILQNNLKQNYLSIDEMKRINNQMEDEIQELKQLYKLLQIQLQKQKDITNLTSNENLQLNKEIQKLKDEISTFQQKISNLLKKAKNDQEYKKHKINKLKQQNKIIIEQANKLKETIAQQNLSLEKSLREVEIIEIKLKDVFFERNDLEEKYKQTLQVIEMQLEHIKNLNIRISQIQQNYLQESSNSQKICGLIQSQQSRYEKQLQNQRMVILKLDNQLEMYKQYIHPMIYEDILAYCINLKTQLVQNLKAAKQSLKQQKDRKNMIESNLLKATQQINQLRQIIEEQKLIKNWEIEYQKQKEKQLVGKLQKTELALQGYKLSDLTIDSAKAKIKQKQYLDLVNSKTQKIQSLTKQLKNTNRQVQKLLLTVQKISTQLTIKDQEINIIKLQNIELVKQKQQFVERNARIQKQKQEIKLKYIQSQKQIQNSITNNGNKKKQSVQFTQQKSFSSNKQTSNLKYASNSLHKERKSISKKIMLANNYYN